MNALNNQKEISAQRRYNFADICDKLFEHIELKYFAYSSCTFIQTGKHLPGPYFPKTRVKICYLYVHQMNGI